MNITYKNEKYSQIHLNELVNRAPFFEPGILFINQWLSDTDTFNFKSSGSTGAVKTITTSRNQILKSVALTANSLDLKKTDRALVCLAPEYVATKMMLARCLVLDLEILLVHSSSNPLEELNENERIDFASFVPLQVEQMIDSGYSERLSKINNVLMAYK